MKYINKLQKSSSRYYNFLEKTVKGMRDYALSSPDFVNAPPKLKLVF